MEFGYSTVVNFTGINSITEMAQSSIKDFELLNLIDIDMKKRPQIYNKDMTI